MNRNVVGIVVAVITLLAIAITIGLLMYQRRGETVYENEQAFTGHVLRFAFQLETGGEYAVLLTQRIHYTAAYEYRLALRLQLPSGKMLEREILDFDRMSDETSISVSKRTGSVAFTFADEPGEAVLTITIAKHGGDVAVKSAKVVVKRRE